MQRCLTPRSRRGPTAGHQGPPGGTRYIFASPGLASCRRRPLSSNVMPHRTRLTPAAARFGWRSQHTKGQTRFPPAAIQRPCAWRPSPSRARTSTKTELLVATSAGPRVTSCRLAYIQARDAKDGDAAPQNKQVRASGQKYKLRVHAGGAHRASHSEPLGRGARRSGGVPPLLRRQPRRGSFCGAPAEITNSSLFRATRVRHNPSLKRSANGRPPGPAGRYGVHFLPAGPGVLPSSPA